MFAQFDEALTIHTPGLSEFMLKMTDGMTHFCSLEYYLSIHFVEIHICLLKAWMLMRNGRWQAETFFRNLMIVY